MEIFMVEMIYDFKTHSLYNDAQSFTAPKFSFVIDTLEMFFELETGRLVAIQGFFPIINARVRDIALPRWEYGEYMLKNVDLSEFEPGMAYSLTKTMPKTRKYFGKTAIGRDKLKYDKEKGVICIGCEAQTGDTGIKVNDNILCCFDENSTLKCVYLIPTRFV